MNHQLPLLRQTFLLDMHLYKSTLLVSSQSLLPSGSSNGSSLSVSSDSCPKNLSFPVPNIIASSSGAIAPIHSNSSITVTSVNDFYLSSKLLSSTPKTSSCLPVQNASFSSQVVSCSSSFSKPLSVSYSQTFNSQVLHSLPSLTKDHSVCNIVKDSKSSKVSQSTVTSTFPLVSYISESSNVPSPVLVRSASSYKSVHELSHGKPVEGLVNNISSSTVNPPSSAYSSLLLPPSSKLSFLVSSSASSFDSNCSTALSTNSFLSE